VSEKLASNNKAARNQVFQENLFSIDGLGNQGCQWRIQARAKRIGRS